LSSFAEGGGPALSLPLLLHVPLFVILSEAKNPRILLEGHQSSEDFPLQLR
jgi:hypothetical protein